MSEFPARAKVVIIGAGIVGNSIAYHLANLGWKDILQIDKGPLPNPGGSTGHASNFLFLVDHNKEMAELTLESAWCSQSVGTKTLKLGVDHQGASRWIAQGWEADVHEEWTGLERLDEDEP